MDFRSLVVETWGGGSGLFVAPYGLIIDRILEYELVDASGKIVLANQLTNPDLNWALRGAGAGYIGIITRVKAKIFEAGQAKFTFVQVFYTFQDIPKAWDAVNSFQDWVLESQVKINVDLAVANDAKFPSTPTPFQGVLIYLTHVQVPSVQKEGPQRFLKAVRDIFLPPAIVFPPMQPTFIQLCAVATFVPAFVRSPFTSEMTAGNRYHSLYNVTPTVLPDKKSAMKFLKAIRKDRAAPRYFKAKSLFVNRRYGAEEMAKVFGILGRIPEGNVWVSYLAANQDVLSPFARNATAYAHRDAYFNLGIQYEGSVAPADVEIRMKYIYELWVAVNFMDDGESYQGYLDSDFKDPYSLYYKENLPKLIKIKRKWDPNNYFSAPFSIPVRADAEN